MAAAPTLRRTPRRRKTRQPPRDEGPPPPLFSLSLSLSLSLSCLQPITTSRRALLLHDFWDGKSILDACHEHGKKRVLSCPSPLTPVQSDSACRAAVACLCVRERECVWEKGCLLGAVLLHFGLWRWFFASRGSGWCLGLSDNILSIAEEDFSCLFGMIMGFSQFVCDLTCYVLITTCNVVIGRS